MPACLRRNVYPIRERPSVDRGERGPRGEDRSGPSTCEGCGRRFWSWDLGQCWHCDDCRPRPRPPAHGKPKADLDDEAWVRAARRDEAALARYTRTIRGEHR
jgi:hypothetical protein